jgi:predicted O-linked N-acetylglucosamine transferase (SPINDLY family)
MKTSDLEALIKNRKFSEYIRCALLMGQSGKLDLQSQANLAAAYASLGQLSNASEVAKEVINKIKDNKNQKKEYRLMEAMCGNIIGIEARRNRNFGEAARHFQRSHNLHPIDEYLGNYALILKDLGRTQEALEYFQSIFNNKNTSQSYLEGLVLSAYYDDIPLAKKTEIIKACGETYRNKVKSDQWSPHFYRPDSVLRVGFVSGDLHQHAVSSFLSPFNQPCERFGVEVHYFYTGIPIDGFTKRLVQAADGFHFCHSLTDSELLKVIRTQRIDVLIDLSGHTRNNRLGVFAMRAAPVQASWLGFGFTSGVPNLDYRLSHDSIDPPEIADVFYSETVVGIHPTPFCFKPQKIVDVESKSSNHPLLFTFASVTNIARISRRSAAVWSRILKRCDKSVLLIEYPRDQSEDLNGNYLRGMFADCGINGDRLVFIDRINENQYSIFNRIDVVLDPLPSNQGTMTFDALYMGVPVITLKGECAMHRMGAGLLEILGGCEDFISSNEAEYVEAAVSIYKKYPNGLSVGARNANRTRFLESPLCHPDRFIEGFFRAIREIYVRTLLANLGEVKSHQIQKLHAGMADINLDTVEIIQSLGEVGMKILAHPSSPWNLTRQISVIDSITDPKEKKATLETILSLYSNNQRLIRHYSVNGVRC